MASPSRARGTRLPPSPLGHPLPPIRAFLAAELSLPLPAPPRHDSVPMDVDPVLPRVLQPRSSPYPGLSSHRNPPHTAPLLTPSSSSSSLFRSSTPRLRRSPPRRDPVLPHHHSSSAPPAFSYVLRPSPSGGLVTSVHTTRPRSRSLHQPTPPSGGGAGPDTGSSGGTSSSGSGTTTTTTAIRRARAESDGARRHVCPTCQKRFNRPSTLRTHENVHTGLRPFACPHHSCAKVFSVASNMRRHYLRAHADAAAADEDDLDADDDHLEWVPMYEAH